MNDYAFKRHLEERTLSFSVNVINLLDKIPREGVLHVLVQQLVQTVTSIGANCRAANRAESRNDFICKIGVVERECSECEYGLLILLKTDLLAEVLRPELQRLYEESLELAKLFSAMHCKAKLTKEPASQLTH